MWLTGFDAPVLHTLYVDKPMRDHGLLQAIARVNRVFRDKPGGLIVDYIGIGEDLRASLRAYDDADLDEPVIPARAGRRGAVGEVRGALRDAAPGRLPPGRAAPHAEPEQLFCDCLQPDPRERRAHAASSSTRRRRSRAGTRSRAPSRRRSSCATTIGFFNKLAAEVRKITAPDGAGQPRPPSRRCASSSPRASRPARSSTCFGDRRQGPPRDLGPLRRVPRLDHQAKTEHPNVQVRLLEKLLNDEIRGRHAHQPDAGEAVQRGGRRGPPALRAASSSPAPRSSSGSSRSPSSLRDARRRHEQLGLSVEEAAFYDALAGGVEDVKADPAARNDRARARRRHPRRPHRRLGRPRVDRGEDPRQDQAAAAQAQLPAAARPTRGGGGDRVGVDYAAQLVLDQAKALYRYWPDVEVGDRLFI